MGVKALIYFEIVTTLALFIGWGAITVSRAGVGVTLPAAVETTQIQQPGQSSPPAHRRRRATEAWSRARLVCPIA